LTNSHQFLKHLLNTLSCNCGFISHNCFSPFITYSISCNCGFIAHKIRRVYKFKAFFELSSKGKKTAILSESCPRLLEISEDTWAHSFFSTSHGSAGAVRAGCRSLSVKSMQGRLSSKQPSKQEETSVECIFNQWLARVN